MTKSQRSTTGCTTCKSRRKKCDEAKPQCLRCLASCRSCSYDYVEHPQNEKHRVKRTKPAPQNKRTFEAETTHCITAGLSSTDPSAFVTLSFASNPTSSVSHDMPANNTNLDFNHALPLAAVQRSLLVPSQSHPIGLNSAFHRPLDLVRLPTGVSRMYGTNPASSGSGLHGLEELDLGDEDDEDENKDPEGVLVLLCASLTLDRNAKDNTLPFVLQCYSEWAITSVFEPRKMAYIMRDQVIGQFSYKDSRIRTILIANVMKMYARSLAIDDTGTTILGRLALAAQTNATRFMEIPPSPVRDLDRQHAIRILDNLLEFLCKANANDPRVVRTHKGFMRLIRGLKPGRHPDCLIAPIVVAGVATVKERDRDTLRQRISNVKEWSTRGIAGNNHAQVIEHVWTRTRDEGRPAIWSDLRDSYYRISGK
ncbi:unnamed protein product [Rhizoctonia solani]|uniref:Zn(2)-C6 fungal-type domain-containing protein n=1 Tax=Rhizoctonia solani TaxID=456999 RepID=A0A8H3AYA0_9AGAM|nr:unnamed protein product [Rhizoctonia solani]